MLKKVTALVLLLAAATTAHGSDTLARVRALLSSARSTRDLYQGESGQNKLAAGEEFIDREWHGFYNDEREAFQRDLIAKFLRSVKPSESPEILFTAGAFASGKTRIVGELFSEGWLKSSDFLIINMDHFRSLIPEYRLLADFLREDPEAFKVVAQEFQLVDPGSFVQTEVGYLQERLLWQGLPRELNIAVDGSLGNLPYFERLIAAIRERFKAYKRLGVIHTDAGERAIERALQRGEERGRVISRASVVRSMQEVAASYQQLRPKFDYFIEVDNSGDRPLIQRAGSVARGEIVRGLSVPIAGPGAHWKALGTDFDRALEGRLRKNLHFYDIIFDVDWTLFYALSAPTAGSIEFGGQHFLPYRGLTRFFQVLFTLIPNLRVHFVSGAAEARIRHFLSSIQVDAQSSLLDLSYSVVGKEHLPRRTGALDTAKFIEQFAKNFDLITPLAVPERTALLDDQPDFATPPLRAANSHGNYAHFPSFAAAKASAHPYAPKTPQEWWLDHDRLALLIAAIEESVRRDLAHEEDFADAMQSILGARPSSEAGAKRIDDPSLAPYFDRGRELLGFSEMSCEELGAPAAPNAA